MRNALLTIAAIALMASCSNESMKITVVNDLPSDRMSEAVSISYQDIISVISLQAPADMIVTDCKGKELPSQLIYEGGASPVSLIFMPEVRANSKSCYFIKPGKPSSYDTLAYGRFVPERYDDYAWENDRIAFRIYGTALIEKDGPSNGLDVWVKRTDRMVINRWYSEYLAGKNTYHDDNGEGCDCYKVGPTLGAGAMAPFNNDTLWLGINFESYETLDNGPLRTSFRLHYPPFMVEGTEVHETRTITLDAGSQLNMITEEYTGPTEDFPVAAGIVLRDEGTAMQLPEGTPAIAYRLDIGENGTTYIGTVLTTPVTATMERNGHLLAVTTCTPGTPLTYYTGAGWNKWGFESDSLWTAYLTTFSEHLKNPLKVIVH